MNSPYDVIILGAGAAGLMCAAQAGARGRKVLVIEHAEAVGKKILISGGGRCNFTNIHTAPDRFLSANPHFAKSALSRYTSQDFLALVESHGIAWHEKTLGQLFCDGSARGNFNVIVTFEDGSMANLQQSLCGNFDYPKELIEVSHRFVTIAMQHHLQVDQRGLTNQPLTTYFPLQPGAPDVADRTVHLAVCIREDAQFGDF